MAASSEGTFTRSLLAIILVLNIVVLTGYLGITDPDGKAFTVLLGMVGAGSTAIIGYYFGSSSSSDKKDADQAKVAERLAAKVATAAEQPIKFAWWSLFTDQEKQTFEVAAQTDGRVKAFIAAAQMGRAEDADLDYLVSVNALAKDRADFLKAT